MKIKNIFSGKTFETTKDGWSKMNEKHKKLFDIVDSEDAPDSMEIQVTNNTQQTEIKKQEHANT